MKKIWQLTVFFLLLSSCLPGQNDGTLAGKVLNISNEAIEFASLSLYQSSDSSFVTGMVSDAEGAFEFQGLKPDSYYLLVSHILYRSARVSIAPDFSHDLIILEKAVQELDEVIVSTKRLAIQSGLDKITLNPEEMIAAAGGSAIDVLKTVPIINISPEGAITLRGNADIQVLVNGKVSGMVAVQGTQFLNELDASMIESIEIITSPSAKNSPDGGAGIINIILKKDQSEGFKGSLSLGIGNRNRYNLSPKLSYRKDKLNFFLRYNLRTRSRYRESQTEQIRNDTLHFDQSGSSKLFDFRNSGQFGLDYFLNKRQYLTLSGQLRYRSKENRQNQQSEVFSKEVFSESRSTSNSEPEQNKGYGVTLSFFSESDDKSQKTQVSLELVHSVEEEGIERVDQIIEAGTNPLFFDGGISNYVDINDGVFLDLSSKRPLGAGVLEVGGQYFYRNIEQLFDYRLVDSTLGNFQKELTQEDRFVYKDHVPSAYIELEQSVGKFKFGVGIRLEYSSNKYTSIALEKDFGNEFFNIFPSAKIAYPLSETSTIQANYGRRINRPSPNRLNPFPNIANAFQIEYGNPNLLPEYIDQYNLGFAKSFQKSSLHLNIFWKTYQGLIQKISGIDDNGIRIIAPVNLDRLYHYGGDLTYSFPINESWRINTGLVAFRNDFTSETGEIENKGFTYQSKLNSSWKLSKKLDWQFSMYYNSAITRAQGETRPQYYLDTSWNYELIKDKADLSLSISDVFNSLKELNIIDIPAYYSYNETKVDTRRIRFSFRYDF